MGSPNLDEVRTTRLAIREHGDGWRVLVGVDGSRAAAAALSWAGRLASRVNAEVVVANVFEPDQAEMPPEHYEP